MNSNILVSIITVCYNSKSTISHTIESVLRQAYDKIEYIIVDGGSIDGTVNMIQSYVNKAHGKNKWISESDNGIYDAMNKGEISRDLFGTDITQNSMVIQADILILHWINSFLSVNSIYELKKSNKPVIWFMHDMWLYTEVLKEIKEKEKNVYNISGGKKVVLFGAADNGTENKMKRFGYLSHALQYLSKDKYLLAIFGKTNCDSLLKTGFEFKELGYISSESEMANIYNIADVFVSHQFRRLSDL